MIKISILGCGWLGSKLGSYLNKTSYIINGSSTKGLNGGLTEQNQIKPYTVNIKETIDLSQYNEAFFDCDTLIISLKPNRRENDLGYFENQINVCTLLAKKFSIKQIIFWSSTSVYGDYNQIADEESPLIPTRPSGNSLIKAEQLLLKETSFSTTILRLGGLIGYDRNPFHVIKNNRRTGSLYIPVNLVHADDVIQVTEKVINAKNNNIYNVVCDEHPLRIQYYQQAYQELNIVPNAFEQEATNAFKVVDNKKLKAVFNYEFLLKNPTQLYTYKPLLSE